MVDNAPTRRSTDGLSRVQILLSWSAATLLLALVVMVVRQEPYQSRHGFGYALGVIGGSLMLVLFIYPLRKRIALMQAAGSLPSWFRLHMICGVLGPVLILFHATFEIKSINAAVAVVCMLLVAVSGLVGRFLYRRIHYGLYGRLATADDMRKGLDASLSDLSPRIEFLPELQQLVEDFNSRINQPPHGWMRRCLAFLLIGRQRRRTMSAVRQRLQSATAGSIETGGISVPGITPAEAENLLSRVGRTCGAIQRAAQFSIYEKLFALWHLAHVPFVYLFVLTAVAHVVAVHIY